MSRQTPTSRRSPSILVTDVRHQKAHSAPFVSRRLNSVSVDSLLSNTSEVPSAQRRTAPRRSLASSSNYGNYSHRSRMAGSSRRPSESSPLLGSGPQIVQGYSTAHAPESSESSTASRAVPEPVTAAPLNGGMKKPVKPVPQLSKSLPSRTSKQSQRLVLIPEADTKEPIRDSSESREARDRRRGPGTSSSGSGTSSAHHKDDNDSETMRVTSYLISEGVRLTKAANYLKEKHRARVRLYDEALFADYLLPLLPGNGVDFRVMSALGDNRTMERMIDMSEQRDHHYEYFSASETAESDPSEPQDFSPRPSEDAPISKMETGSSSSRPSASGAGAGSNDSDREGAETHAGEHDTQESASSSNSNGADRAASEVDDRERIRREKEEDRKRWEQQRKLESYTSHAEIFVFNYGVVVFWNFTEVQEKQILADLCLGGEHLVIHPCNDQEIQSEELEFTYALGESEKPQIFNDLITLNNNSHMLKLALSHAMAQSTILCGFEDRMQAHLKDVRGVPKSLALTGKLGLNREQLLKISGRLFKLRVDVNLSSNVLDIPEFFWDSEPSLFPLFNALREYLEIDERVLVLNERQSVFLELTSILGDTIAEFNMDRITIIVIWLIVLSICVSLTEIAVRFLILRKASG